MPDNENSMDYALRCSEIIRADPNISDDTIMIMFMEYGRKLLDEKLPKQQ